MQRRRERQAGGTARTSKQPAFDHKLLKEPAGPGADCGADRHLATSDSCPCELQARHVRGRRHQQQGHGRQKHGQRRPHLCGHHLDRGDGADVGRTVAAEHRDRGETGSARYARAPCLHRGLGRGLTRAQPCRL